jgi:hypothetical protein
MPAARPAARRPDPDEEHFGMATVSDLENPAVRESVLRILVNQFWVEAWVIDVCARSVAYAADVDEKLETARHMADTARQMAEFRRIAVETLGADWDALDPGAYGFGVMNKRYEWLNETTDPVELYIGLYMFAHGVFGHLEFSGLHQCSPEVFPRYAEYSKTIDESCASAVTRLKRLTEQRPELLEHAQRTARKYGDVLIETSGDSSFAQFLEQLVAQGLVPADTAESGLLRFVEIFGFLLPEPSSGS